VFDCLLFLLIIHTGACGLLQEAKELEWLHRHDFGDVTLHDQELRIIDVELDRAEQVFDVLLTFILAVYLGFGRTILYRLSYSDLIAVSQSHTGRTLRLIGVVQDQSDRCPFDSSCPAFVDQLLLVVNSDVFEGRNAHHEAYCVEYVRFP